MRIAIVGGGPAGLFFARLMKRQKPNVRIDVYEQNPENATYGFGVTLANNARDRLRDIDPETHTRLAEAMVFTSSQKIGLNGEEILLRYAGNSGSIERLTLLQILGELSRDVGVNLIHDKRISAREDLAGYDLIVGADGANSAVRALWPDRLTTRTKTVGNHFAWYGVDRALSPNALMFRFYRGGCFIAHYYAYTATRSTFVAECDAQTWTRCGLDKMTDGQRKDLMQEIYADVLEGGTLLENRSIWRQFTAQVAETWYHDKAVLIGDALRVAHFSIGSGTRLAMDDALDLHEALVSTGSVAEALPRFVEMRAANRDLFTEATERSYEWYDRVREAMQTDIVSFAYDFLTRTGRVDDARLQKYAPEFYREHLAPRLERACALGLAG